MSLNPLADSPAANTALALVGGSTWALHDILGSPPVYGPEAGSAVPQTSPESQAHSAAALLALPAELARHGFDCLQICHFHLPTRDAGYLTELRSAITESGLALHALLVDAGDMTHPESGPADEAWIADWVPVASRLGAQEVRVIAGKSVDDGAMARSVAAMRRLAAQGGVGIITENWFPLLATPAAVQELLERCEGDVRLLLDFGNWSEPGKHAALAEIAPYASGCHAKAGFLASGKIDADDYQTCLTLPYPPGFAGPFVLVNRAPGVEPWEGVGVVRDFIVAARP